MQSYILTYHRLRKGEPLIALGSYQEGPLNSAASAVPHSLVEGGGEGGADLNSLILTLRWWSQTAYSRLSYDTRKELSGKF